MVRDFAQSPGNASKCDISSSTLNEKQARTKGKQSKDIYLQPLKKVKKREIKTVERKETYEMFLIPNVHYMKDGGKILKDGIQNKTLSKPSISQLVASKFKLKTKVNPDLTWISSKKIKNLYLTF